MNVYEYVFISINGARMPLRNYQGQPIFIVNVASQCEFTPQPEAGNCSDIKDITAVSVVWGGQGTVDIEMESGEIFNNVAPGNRITFHFCPVCGATVFYRPEKEPDLIAIPVGVFADPSFPGPRVSVYESRRHPWVVVPDDLEHFD